MRTVIAVFAAPMFASAMMAQTWTAIPLGKSAQATQPTQIGIGPDRFIYIGADRILYKIDPATWQTVWTLPLSYGRSTQPTGMCFHSSGIVLELEPDYYGTVTDPSLWAIVPYDGSKIDYHQIGGKNNVGGFGGGSCAVDDKGNIYLSSMYQSSTAMGGVNIAKIVPPNLDQPLAVPGPGASWIGGALIPYLLSSPDGKTIVVVSGYLTRASVALIQSGQIGVPVQLPVSASRPPRMRPDGGTLFVNGSDCNRGVCPTPTISGVATYDLVQGTVNLLNNNGGPSDIGWSATDPYYLLGNSVCPSDLRDWTFQGPFFRNPDDSTGNQQLLVFRKQFADTLVALQADRLLIWDVPRITIARSVVDDATFVKAPSPGNWAAAFGRALSFQPAVGAPSNGSYPTALDATRVQLQYSAKTSFAGLYYTSPGQINFFVPADVPTGTGPLKATFQTVNADGTWTSGNTLTVDVAAFSPGVYAITDQSGRVISDAQGAAPGSTITLWASGLGTVQSGQYGLMWTATPPTVTVGGVTADVMFSGLAPGFLGLYQVNVTLPASIAGVVADLQMTIGGLQTTVKVLINPRGQ